jgi:hypothetical protein
MEERWVKVAAAPDESVALLEAAKQVLEDTTGLGSYAP